MPTYDQVMAEWRAKQARRSPRADACTRCGGAVSFEVCGTYWTVACLNCYDGPGPYSAPVGSGTNRAAAVRDWNAGNAEDAQ